MNWDELLTKMQEINARIDSGCDLRYLEENMSYAFEAGKFYNYNSGSLSTPNELVAQIRQSYQFFSKYLTVYIAKKYDKHLGYELESNAPVSYFDKNIINLSKNMIGRSDFEHIMFTIFHEFRHKMQHDDFNLILGDINGILSIDPASIVLLKESITQADTELYNANHNCFISEHDANLFALSECGLLIDKKKLELDYGRIGETTNYIDDMINGIDLTGEEFSDKQHFPIVYEQDYRFKKFIAGKKVNDNSMLSLVYNSNGRPKTYAELMEGKRKLLARYKGQSINKKSSTNNYENWASPKRAEQHIEEIYKLIIASDPILTLQEYFYMYNNLKGQLSANKWSEKIYSLLENCPQLIDIYSEEINNILKDELSKGNIALIQKVMHNFSDKKIAQEIQTIVANMGINAENKTRQNPNENSEHTEKNKAERQLDNGQGKKTKYKPRISESVKRTIILQSEKQKLDEMKEQLKNYHGQQDINQETIYEEDILDMSM